MKLEVLKPWITKRVTGILGMEDEVVVEFIVNQLEAEKVSRNCCMTTRVFIKTVALFQEPGP